MKFERGKRYDQKCKITIGGCFLYFRQLLKLVSSLVYIINSYINSYISWFFNCFGDRFATIIFNIIGRNGT